MHENFAVRPYESAYEILQILEENYVHIHEKTFVKYYEKLKYFKIVNSFPAKS